MQTNNGSRSRSIVSLLVALCAVNTLLTVVVVWAVAAGLLVPVAAPLLIAVSLAEMLVWKRLAGSTRPAEAAVTTDSRVLAMRRSSPQRRQSMTDEATGLYSRWYFERRIAEEAARCIRYKHSMAVVVLRVGAVSITTFSSDGWQQRSLEAAKRAAGVVREVDISAALAPFEFGICLIHCDRDGAYRALERLLQQLPEYECEAGVAVFPDEGYEANGLIDVATARMRSFRLPASA